MVTTTHVGCSPGTTNQTGLGEDLDKPNQYSVIRKLLEILPESLSA